MFVFDNKKRRTNQVVKYAMIAMFMLSTAHIVSRHVRPTFRSVFFICIRLIALSPLLIRLEPSGGFAITRCPNENNSLMIYLCDRFLVRFRRVSLIGDQGPQRATSTARPSL